MAIPFQLSGRIEHGAGASLEFTPVYPDGRPALGATDTAGDVVGGSVTVTAAADGSFSANLQPSAGRDWLWRLVVTLAGGRFLFEASLLPMPREAATLDQLIPPARHRAARGAKFTDLRDTPASTTGHVGEFLSVGADGSIIFTLATPGQGISGVVVEDDGSRRGSVQRFDFRGAGVSAEAAAGEATVEIDGVPPDGVVRRDALDTDLRARVDGAARYDRTEVLGPRSFAMRTQDGDDSPVNLPPVEQGDIGNGAVGTDQLANGAVTGPKLHAGAVQQSQAD